MGFISKLFFTIFSTTILLVAILIGLIKITDPTFYKKPSLNEVNKETEFKLKIKNENSEKIDVLNSNGSLNLIGWTNNDKNLIFDSNKVNPSTTILLNKQLAGLRFKKWDAYAFSSPSYVGTFAVFDLGYIGGIMFHMGEIKNYETENTEKIENDTNKVLFEFLDLSFHPTIEDQCSVSSNLNNGYCLNGVSDNLYSKHFDQNKSELKKLKLLISPEKNHYIEFDFKRDLSNGSDFSFKIDLKLQGKDLDSMVMLIPIIEDRSLFYYNVKSYNLQPKGELKINEKTEDTGNFLFAYDAGRGAWPIKSGWVWVYGQGKTVDSKNFGFNFGHGFTHPSAKFTEDSFFINGKLQKIHNLQYTIESKVNKNGYNDYVFSNKSEENYEEKSICELRFTTTGINGKSVNLVIADLVFNIKYGVYSGYCFDEEGSKYELANVTGIIEEKMSIW